MRTDFPEGARKVGGGARTGANDAGTAYPVTTTMGGAGNPYGSGAGAGFGGGMTSGYGSMGPGAMNGANQRPMTTGMGAGGGTANGSFYSGDWSNGGNGGAGAGAGANGAGSPATTTTTGAAGGPNGPGNGFGNPMAPDGAGGYGGGMGGGPGNANGMGANGYGSMYGRGGPGGAGSMYGNGGGYAPGGYAMGGSMYGPAGSMYGTDIPDDMIVVSKVFSSRRDLDTMASGLDFPRRFDSYWPSYRSNDGNNNPGAKPSAYNNSGDLGGGKMSMLEPMTANSNRDIPGLGAAGAAPDGTTAKAAPPPTPATEQKAPPKASPQQTRAVPPAAPAAAQPDQAEEERRRQQQREAEDEERRRRGQAAAQALQAEREKQAAMRKAAEEKKRAEEEEAAKRKAAELERQRSLKPPPPQDDDDDIPVIKDDFEQQPAQKSPQRPVEQPPQRMPSPKKVPAPSPQHATEKVAPQPKPASPQQLASAKSPAKPANAERAAPPPAPVAEERPRSRPRSRPHRTASRTRDIDLVEVPKGEEVKDDLDTKVLTDPAQAALEQARAERQREREQQRAQRMQQRAAQEQAEREREQLAQQRREAKAAEERRQREEIARLDEERRKARAAALEAREREKEEEKRRFEKAKAAEAEKERARVQAVLEERQRALAKESEAAPASTGGAPPRSASRPRSRRPGSTLRAAAIPEQPPDVVGSQIKDTLADELASSSRGNPNAPRKRGHTPLPTPTTVEVRKTRDTTPAQRAIPRSVATHGAGPAAAPSPKVMTPATTKTASPPAAVTRDRNSHTPGAARTGYTPQSVPATNEELSPEKEPDRNPIRTLVVVERMKAGNRAVTHEGNTVQWKDYPIDVTEVKQRGEDDFSYHSEVVHKLCDYASRGYNVAVLSAEAPNTVSRAQSPVWPVLLHIVDSVLKNKTDSNGNLKKELVFECALAYFDKTNVKDLFAEDQPFRPLAVKPSPVSGPRLSEMTYVQVTDSREFEEALTVALSRAVNDPVVSSLTTGFIGAYLTMKEEFIENGKKDVYVSSINVVSAGSDMTVYEDALSRNRGPYGILLHVDVLGPCFTCFMYNVADDDTVQRSPLPQDSSVHNELVTTYQMLERMSKTENLPLRSGSVRRFVHYIRKNQHEIRERIKDHGDKMEPEKLAKLQKYLMESEAIFREYYALIEPSSDPHREL